MIDFQKFVKPFNSITCVISVEKKDDDSVGCIRIEAGNEAFIQATKMAISNKMTQTSNEFIPGSPYERYMKKELNFENYCYQCAIKKKPIHAYIRPEYFDFCIDMYMLPLNIDDPKKGYCTYTQTLNTEVNIDSMSDISVESSTSILKTCIRLRGAKDLRKATDDVLEDIRKICGASYGCIMLTNFVERTCSVFSESIEDKSSHLSLRDFLTDDFIDYAKIWLKILAGSKCLMVKNEDDLNFIKEQSYDWYKSLKEAQVDSLVLLPLQYGTTLLGFIWVANFDTSNTIRIKETLEISTFFIASEIANYQLLGKLEELSNMDLLTGAKNRNAMNNRVSQFIKGEVPHKTLATVFADLNGLKPVNDNQGHDAGDKLLKEASWTLEKAFRGGEVYRAGGDEFLIVLIDKTKEEIEAKVQKLREDSQIPGHVSFSLGYYYDDKGCDIRKAMHEADVRMYEDKKQFYAMHPELKKR